MLLMKKVGLGSALVALGLLAGGARAAVLQVPAQYATIQAAIDAASAGDEIVVAPGSYLEQIDFKGKAISVHSSGGAAVTVIDGSGSEGSTVTFAQAETSTSVLQGFTITGGTGVVDPFPFGLGGLVGGGVLIYACAPSLVDLVVTGNSADRGAGVMIEQNGPPNFPLLQGCTFAGNTAVVSGGGVSVTFGGATLTNCMLQDNTAGLVGGGLDNSRGRVTLQDCTVSGNDSNGGGGVASFISPGDFGGLVMKDCLIENNHATGSGGGLSATTQADGFSLGGARAESCRFIGNTAPAGAAIIAWGDSGAGIRITSCEIFGNGAPGAAAIELHNAPRVDFCTVADNLGPGIVGNSVYAISDSIVRGNVGTQLQGVSAVWSDIQSGWPGAGNLDVDPLFVNAAGGDYHLQLVSPCRDRGDPALLSVAALDIDDEARVQGGRIDIGSDELAPFSGWQDLGFALAGSAGAPVLSGSGTLLAGQPVTVSLSNTKPHALATLVLGGALLVKPFKGGTLIPTVDLLLPGLVTNGAGAITLNAAWPAGLPAGFKVFLQAWMPDALTPAGFSASNGLSAGTP